MKVDFSPNQPTGLIVKGECSFKSPQQVGALLRPFQLFDIKIEKLIQVITHSRSL